MNDKKRILVVDDVDINREILISLLDDNYEMLEAANGREAIDIITKNFREISMILLDLMMPEIDGFQVLEILKQKTNIHIPIIVITANNETDKEKRALSLGAVDFIQKPFDPDIVKYRVDTHIALKSYQDHLENMVDESVSKISATWSSVILALADVIECRNQESGLHVKRTSVLTKLILQNLNERNIFGYTTTPRDLRFITEISGLHDIGKISIPDNILTKPGKLTDVEYEIMKTHTISGDEMAEKITRESDPAYQKFCREICRHHHEKWDGSGYPDKLSGSDIPLSARVVALADAYDAMTNDRVYRKGFSHEKAIAIILQDAGTHFDPVIAKLFAEIGDQIAKADQDLQKQENQ